MVNVGTGSSKSRFIRTEWPIEEGLTAGTNKLRKKWKLEVQERSNVSERDKVGL